VLVDLAVGRYECLCRRCGHRRFVDFGVQENCFEHLNRGVQPRRSLVIEGDNQHGRGAVADDGRRGVPRHEPGQRGTGPPAR
jgi:hypothetical protein